MKINNILILGSTRLTEATVNLLRNSYHLVGYVPSKNPTVKGDILLPEVSIDSECDIKLSIQYDQKVEDTDNCFNVHTGLLPEYGGTNLLSYTLQNKETEQGLTFHKMTEQLDFGPIISKTSYPVLPTDDVADLYQRVLTVGPTFVLSSLLLLETFSEEQVEACHKETPTMYKRGEFEIPKELLQL